MVKTTRREVAHEEDPSLKTKLGYTILKPRVATWVMKTLVVMIVTG